MYLRTLHSLLPKDIITKQYNLLQMPVIHHNRGLLQFLLGAARFRWTVTLQFLHQQLTAATQNVPELPQRAAALQGSTAVLQTHTHTHSSTHPFSTDSAEENLRSVGLFILCLNQNWKCSMSVLSDLSSETFFENVTFEVACLCFALILV